MKLAEHVENIRKLIDKSYRNRLGRMGINLQWAASNLQDAVESKTLTDCKLPNGSNDIGDLRRIIEILSTFEKETGTVNDAYEKLVEELTFTLFNRIAAMKVMEAHTLHPEIITHRSQHGDRSFAHFLWLEQNPDGRNEENEGLVRFLEDQLTILSTDIPLFSTSHPYHLLPTAIELHGIINAFNQVENDDQVETNIWQSDDVLGWLYESYNFYKKQAHDDSGEKTEFNKVSIQSQFYTPRWVVKFLVDNSLGKLYLEMYPDSAIKGKYKIANAPKIQTRERKPLTAIRMIDLATGSGNFVLYGFDLFYDMYLDQIENYSADYNENKLPELIIKNNLYGIDLDDRAVQLAQLGLYIKAKRVKRTAKIDHFNIVSSDFFLPDYKVVKELFYEDEPLSPELEKIVIDLWADLQQAYKFGSLLRIEEKFNIRLQNLIQEFGKPQIKLFEDNTLANFKNFKDTFFSNLQKAVTQNAEVQGLTFLNTKTKDAITFLELLTQKYDIAVANPPYTDSADFGSELKKFIDLNYKQPFKFNTNLYSSFIKKCCEVVENDGKVALIHPPTFMFIKTFEDVRKYIVDKMHISLFVEWGYLGIFNTRARVDSAMYVLEKNCKSELASFIKLTDLYEGKRFDALFEAYNDLLDNRPNKLNFFIDQQKFKIIESYPFIYWISEEFRMKFKEGAVEEKLNIVSGLGTGDNCRFLRFWWEVSNDSIRTSSKDSNKKWVRYAKGGESNKWYGNLWLTVNWANDGDEIINCRDEAGRQRSRPQNRQFYFKEGITCSGRSSSKGMSYRIQPADFIFDVGATGIIPKTNVPIEYYLGLLNSKLILYIINCLNPTVNTSEGDVRRIPYSEPNDTEITKIVTLAKINIALKRKLAEFSILEYTFQQSPLFFTDDSNLQTRLIKFFDFESFSLATIFINESIINEAVFDIYKLSNEDKKLVTEKEGVPVGNYALLKQAKEKILARIPKDYFTTADYIEKMNFVEINEQNSQLIKSEIKSFYQGNGDLEDFCINHEMNPVNVWYWFTESNVFPQGRASEIALEFIIDSCRTILMEDDDGIIPLVGLPDEPKLSDRLENHCLQKGFSSAQFMQLDGLLGHPINEYIEHYFFKNFSDHLNLFPNLPKTPFIWHLSSGDYQGFEAYIIIYKWNRDSLFKLKTQYLSKRVENLEYRQIQLQDSLSAQAQTEKELIRLQLNEIAEFTRKIEELIAEGYDPKLDDGVGKNIAPLQKKGLLRCEVLNKKQLEKYLNADW